MAKHVYENHKDELGFKSVADAAEFIVDVVRNADHIRDAGDGKIMFSIENGRNKVGKRAITIVVEAETGEFLGIKTAGYDRMSSIKKCPELWARGANDASAADAASANVTSVPASESGSPAGGTSNQNQGTSNDKGTEKAGNTQTDNAGEERVEAERKAYAAEAQKGAIKDVANAADDELVSRMEYILRLYDLSGRDHLTPMSDMFKYQSMYDAVDAEGIEIATELEKRGYHVGVDGVKKPNQPAAENEPKPVGKGVFGNIYDQFKGKLKEGIAFLAKMKGGYLRGVLHRDDIGDIDLPWGVAHNDYNGKGLAHIIRKHIEKFGDFANVDEAAEIITDVVENGKLREEGENTVAIEKGNYRVVVVRDCEGNWILSAFDFATSKKDKLKRKDAAASGTPGQPNVEAGAVTSNLSEDKGTEKAGNTQTDNAGETLGTEGAADGGGGVGAAGRRNAIGLPAVLGKGSEMELIQRYAEKRGLTITNEGDFWSPFTRSYSNAYVDNYGVIHVNPKANKGAALAAVVGHEIMHTTEGLSRFFKFTSQEHDNLLTSLRRSRDFVNWARAKVGKEAAESLYGKWESAKDRHEREAEEEKIREAVIRGYMEDYSRFTGREFSREEAEREMFADFIGDSLIMTDDAGRSKFMERLIEGRSPEQQKELRSVWQKIVGFFRMLAGQTRYESEAEEMNRIADEFEAAAKRNDMRLKYTDKALEMYPSHRKGGDKRHMFLGEKGAKEADKAEGTTVRMDNLKVAEDMEKAYKELQGSDEHKRMIEASKRVRSMSATSLDDVVSDRDKKSLINKIQLLDNGENLIDGRKVRFVNKIAGKLLGHMGFDYSLIVPKLKELYDTSIPAFSEVEKKQDGHKDHSSNFIGYHHYINKVSLDGNEYYVRFTVQEKKTRKSDYIPNEMHSSHVTSVEIYNANSIETSGIIDPAQMTVSVKPDAKLRNFFNMASETEKDFAKKMKLATGWERGADGKWRYEQADLNVDPSGDRVMYEIAEKFPYNDELDELEKKAEDKDYKLTAEESARYDELLNMFNSYMLPRLNEAGKYLSYYMADDSLLKVYPELKDTMVLHIDSPENFIAYYSPKNNCIYLNSNASYNLRTTLAHEVQHIIQDIEGFAKGGSKKAYVKMLDELKERADAWVWYNKLVALSKEMPGATPWEVERELEKREGDFATRINRMDTTSDGSRSIAFNTFDNGFGEKDLRDAYNKWNGLAGLSEAEGYKRIAGEVEARNVQTRMGYTEEQRRQRLASETEDVPRGEQLVRYSVSVGKADMSNIGEMVYESDFDKDFYQEWLEDNELKDSEKNRTDYWKENVTFEIGLLDNETYHQFDAVSMSYDDMVERYGTKIADKILSDTMKKGEGRLEPILYISNDELDVNDREALNAEAKKLLPQTPYFKGVRGFVLSDGTIINTEMEHNKITSIPGIDDKFQFVKLGNIRILDSAINLSDIPTDEQKKVIRRVVADNADGELYVDMFGKDGSSYGVKYTNPDYNRVINDIRRYYNEGIKPVDVNRYSVDTRYNRQTVEKGFGGLWIADKKEFAKFASAAMRNRSERDGEGVCYTADHFYAYYRNIDGNAIPFIDINLNNNYSQDLIDGIQSGYREGKTIHASLNASLNSLGLLRASGNNNNGNTGNANNGRSLRLGRLAHGFMRWGRYADVPENFVKAADAVRPGDDTGRDGRGDLGLADGTSALDAGSRNSVDVRTMDDEAAAVAGEHNRYSIDGAENENRSTERGRALFQTATSSE
ncbi:MAG: hypothetical protein HUK14_02935, partial [Muribaculaceae bacterium]|nr:hypothetical protein [Muribaculaceae bacterium]